MADPKVTIHIDVKDKAVAGAQAKMSRLTKEIESRGGPAMVKLAKEIRKAEREARLIANTLGKTNKIFTRFTNGIAIGNMMAMGASKAFSLMGEGIQEIGEATKVAARIEVLNGVMQFTGQAAGYSRRQLDENVKALQAQGITITESLGLQQRFIQANLDIALSTDIARIAQDAAVIAGVNSSEAALGLTDAIVKQRPILLKQYGIITSLDQIYNKTAATLGKKRDALTATEKRMGFYNEIMEQGKTIAGAYDTALDFAGKRLTSLPRYFEAAQQAVGRHFLPAFNTAISVTEKLLKGITAAFGDPLDLIAATELKFKNTSAATLKLADRYDELAGKTREGTKEHEELQEILATLARDHPNLITSWDEYGVAIEANTAQLRANLEAKRSLIAIEKEAALKELADQFASLTRMVANYNDYLFIAEPGMERFAVSSGRLRKQIEQAPGLIRDMGLELQELTFKVAAHFPDLVEGTERWNYAVRILRPDLAALVLQTNAAERAIEDLRDTTVEAAAAMPSEGLFPNVIDFKPFMDEIAREKEDARREEERRERFHFSTMRDIRSLSFEADLVGRSEYQAAVMEAERAHNERLAELKADVKLAEAQYLQSKRDSEILLQADLTQIQMDATNELAQMYADRWALVTDATEQVFGSLAEVIVTDTKLIGKEMKAVFEDIGRSVVVHLAKKAVKAIGTYIFKLVAAKTAEKLFGKSQEDTTVATAAQTGAAIALTGATVGVAISAAKATGAMVIESAQVKRLTAHYIALAAAKSAVNPFSAGSRITAAATTKAALVPMLLTGFDDPANDRIAYRHGKDYAQLFMAGIQSEWRAPDFGRDVRKSLPAIQPVGGDGAGITFNINVGGSIVTRQDFVDEIIPEIEAIIEDGRYGAMTGHRA